MAIVFRLLYNHIVYLDPDVDPVLTLEGAPLLPSVDIRFFPLIPEEGLGDLWGDGWCFGL